MKTIEEKARAYDEAIKIAKKYWNSPRTCFDINALTEMFPELKESEDEKIRKMLIEFFGRGLEYNSSTNGVPDKDIVRWLEKQGEKLQGKSTLEAAKEDKVDSQNCVNPADKIETKFKVGDWITNDYCAGKVIELTNDAYLLDTGQGIPFSCEHNVHLWTIQDAKDGDVLVASDDSVFIYAGSTDRHAQFYIALSKYGDFNTEGGNWEDKNCVKPATKEQRDLLFQKMKEAGYTFDFEKKELKKIEQKPAAWSEDYTERMGQIINYLKCQAEEEHTRKRTLLGWVALLKSIFKKGLPEIQIPGTEAARKGIHRIMDVLDWAADKGRISESDCEDYMILLSAYQPQPKPKWSKEDTFKVQRICKYLDEAKKYYADITEVRDCIDWLKHIEQRIGG